MSFTNYESQKKVQELQRSILKRKFAIEKKLKANTLETLLEVESDLQSSFANTMDCINLVNNSIQSDSIQNCLLPNTMGHLNISRSDVHLFRQLFQNSVLLSELLESIKHNCTKTCTFNPMEDTKITPLNENRKMYIKYFKLLKLSRTLRKSLSLLVNGSVVTSTFEKIDDLEIKTATNDSTINSFNAGFHTSSPIVKEKTEDQKAKKHVIEF